MAKEEPPLVVRPGEGRSSRGVSGAPTLIKVTGEQTQGLTAVFEQNTPVGSGPPLHIHHECAEVLYVLEGTYTFTVGSHRIAASRGTLVFVPSGVPHAYVNPGPEEAALLFWCTPAARMAAYIEELGKLPSGPGDAEVVRRIALEHGVEIVGDRLDAARGFE